MGKGFDAFMKNPYWKEYYETARSEELKRYIALMFECDGTDGECEIEDELREANQALSKEDVRWLLERTDNQTARRMYRKRLLAMEEKEGSK